MALIHLLVAPDAGRGGAHRVVDQAIVAIERLGHAVVDITGANIEESMAAAHTAVADQAERIVVVGGDGTIHLALQAVAASNTTLGVIPVGTGNDFARSFRREPGGDVVAAVERALAAPRQLDAMRVGDRWVASIATGGFSGEVNRRANRLRFPRGSSRYTFATLLALPGLRHRPLAITIDGTAVEINTALFAVANTAYFGGGMAVCPDADPTDGRLEITVVGDVGRIALLRWFPRVYEGTHLDHPKAHALRGRTIEIEGSPVDVWGDGEHVGALPLTFEAVPGALLVAV